MKYPSLSLLIDFSLTSTLLGIRIAIPICFLGPFDWNIFPKPFLWQCLSLSLRCVSCMQNKDGFCFHIQSVSPFPGLCSSPLEFAVSGWLWPRFLALSCFCKSWSGSLPAEVPGLELDLFWWRSLTLDLVTGSILICQCPGTGLASGTGFAPGGAICSLS